MLRKGDGKYAAEEAIVSRTLHAQGRANSKLSKFLFPSSSPRQPPNHPASSSQNGSIRDAFQKSTPAKAGPLMGSQKMSVDNTTPRAPNDPSIPLTATSSNAQKLPPPRIHALCANPPDAFKNEPPKAWNTENAASLDQDLEWLASNLDDDGSDFGDWSSPVLPPVQKPEPALPPAPITTTAATSNTFVTHAKTVQSSQGTLVSWSSSPPQHMLPPSVVSRSGSGQTNSSAHSLKRKSGDDFPEVAAPKRRGLPFPARGRIARPGDPTISTFDESVMGESMDTPSNVPKAPKAKYNPLEATASAIKEQRKNHKLQRVQSIEAEAEAGEHSTPSRDDSNDLSPEEVKSITSGGPKTVEPVFLSSEQKHVLDLVTKKNQSVFFTGPAGTGKSVLMRAIIAELKRKWAKDPERLAVTASTGLAACNIGGITLHSFAGIGLGKEDAPTLVKKVRRNAKAKNRWLRTRCLIIDEVSMVDGDLFDKLSQIGRTIRNNGRPWGGIQLVITGDFFQLPPVPDSSKGSKFAFEASTWETSIPHTIGLGQVFRQKDPGFAQMLNEMRVGKITDETVRCFKALARPLRFDDGIETTELFPTRMEVDRANQKRLAELPGQSYRYDSVDTGDQQIRDRLLQNMMAPKTIDLKVGAQVMLIKNIDEQLVNGTIGKIKQFVTPLEWGNSGGVDTETAGDTEDDPIDLDRALKKIKKFANNASTAAEMNTSVPFPVVEFLCTDGSRRTLQCVYDEWKVELPNGEVQAKRSQLPLIMAWALSIHKAQGQTLERVKVDLTRIFEKGQAYVALSRATSQYGLQVLKFDKSKVSAHPKVVQFYDGLYSVDQLAAGQKPAGRQQRTLQGMLGGGINTLAAGGSASIASGGSAATGWTKATGAGGKTKLVEDDVSFVSDLGYE